MSSKNSDDDLTRVLDGWSADAGRVKTPAQTELPLADEVDAQVQRAARPDPARSRLPDDLDLNVPTRFSKWDNRDVTDVDAVLKPIEAVARSSYGDLDAAPWQPGALSTSVRKPPVPGVLDAWKPGCWIGAAKNVFGAVASVVSSAQGPVVDTYAPHVLLALWPPQNMQQPFLARWPQRVLLSAVPAEDAGAELLKFLPPGAEVWVTEPDIDWALLGEAVLLHEPGLRDFQLKELRAFVDAEKLAHWERLNKAYKLPASGQPIERI
jgi:hypothetical protein